MTQRQGKYAQIEGQIRRIVGLNRNCKIALAFRLLKPDAQERAIAWMNEKLGKTYPHEVLTSFGNWGGALDTSQPLPFSGAWTDTKTDRAGSTGKACAYPVLHVKVAVNGDVKFCSCVDYDSVEENIIGSVLNDSLLDIYNGIEARKRWREGLSMCEGCTHYRSPAILGENVGLLNSVITHLGV